MILFRNGADCCVKPARCSCKNSVLGGIRFACNKRIYWAFLVCAVFWFSQHVTHNLLNTNGYGILNGRLALLLLFFFSLSSEFCHKASEVCELPGLHAIATCCVSNAWTTNWNAQYSSWSMSSINWAYPDFIPRLQNMQMNLCRLAFNYASGVRATQASDAPVDGSRPMCVTQTNWHNQMSIILKFMAHYLGSNEALNWWLSIPSEKCIDNRKCNEIGHNLAYIYMYVSMLCAQNKWVWLSVYGKNRFTIHSLRCAHITVIPFNYHSQRQAIFLILIHYLFCCSFFLYYYYYYIILHSIVHEYGRRKNKRTSESVLMWCSQPLTHRNALNWLCFSAHSRHNFIFLKFYVPLFRR